MHGFEVNNCLGLRRAVIGSAGLESEGQNGQRFLRQSHVEEALDAVQDLAFNLAKLS